MKLARVAPLLAAGLAAVLLTPVPAHGDRVGNSQWQLSALNVAAAWRFSTGTSVTVAVLDSGVDAGHPDLRGQVLPGADFVDGTTDGRHDFVGHGTTVAALIAGRDDDRLGVVGVAPHARILPVRVLDARNRYDDATVVADGLRWAVDHGARVVNLSLGGSDESDVLSDAVKYAMAHDVVVVACAGNVKDGEPSEVWYPARESGVIAVAGLASAAPGERGRSRGLEASTPQTTLWKGSLTGPQTALTAPAVDMLGARPGGYWRVEGTSFAAPLVTAAAALVRSRWPDLDAGNVVNRLIRTAHDLGATGRDDVYGFGEVDPLAALTVPVPAVTVNPLDPERPQPAADEIAPAAPVALRAPVRRNLPVELGLLATLVGGSAFARFRRRRPYSWHRSGNYRRPLPPRPRAR